jgi:hypothetical protein
MPPRVLNKRSAAAVLGICPPPPERQRELASIAAHITRLPPGDKGIVSLTASLTHEEAFWVASIIGAGVDDAAPALTEQGVEAARGGAWSQKTVLRMLGRLGLGATS